MDATGPSSAGTAPTEAGLRGWWRTPGAKVVAMTLAVATGVVAAQAAWLCVGEPPSADGMLLLAVIALLFALSEKFIVSFSVRRGAHGISLSEIPLVLGLVLIHPVLLVAVRLVGALAGLTIVRGQRGSKLAFNLSLYAMQVTVAAAVFHLATAGSDPLGVVGWAAAYAATFAADLVSIVLISAVIAVHDDSQEWHRLLTKDVKQLFQVPIVAVTTTLALVTTLVVRDHVLAAILLAVLVIAAYKVFDGYALQTRTHQRVEQLYTFTQSLDGLTDTDSVARTVLGQVRDLVRAESAELVVAGTENRPALRIRLSGRDDYEVLPGQVGARWWRPSQDGAPVLLTADTHRDGGPVDAIAVSVRLGESTGVILVEDSLPELPTFTDDHVRLMQALASHAGVALSEVRLVERLRHTATHDALTGLPNRQQFAADLQEAVDAIRAESGIVGVILLNVDRFNDVNDALGHDIGDSLLREIGRRLHAAFCDRGTVARLGGDEFALVVRNAYSQDEILALADSVRRTIERPMAVENLTLTAQASMGVCTAPEHGLDADRLLRRADVAMYAAKESRAGVRVYRSDDDRNTARRLALMADLRAVIDDGALAVVYQPKVDPRSGRVLGAEALARWQHADGPVSPDEFIPLAERSGLIRPLTRQVLDTALAALATWRRAGHGITVAVNLSPHLLADRGLVDEVRDALRRHALPPGALTLEITENGIMADPTNSRRTLDALNELGVKLSIDDFGTGQSSLGRLADLPIHEMKIDKSFIRHVVTDRNRRAVTDAALQLGRALGLTVVAEGVEDAAEFHYLRRHGCDAIQGYYLSRPVPEAAFLEWLNNRSADAGQRDHAETVV